MPLHNLELIVLKILPYRGIPFNLLTWYRPPNASIDSFEQLDAVISFLEQEGHETILFRDTNWYFSSTYQMVDKNYNMPNHVEHLDRIYDYYRYTQIIEEATRVTTSTSSIVDHSAKTNTNNICQS